MLFIILSILRIGSAVLLRPTLSAVMLSNRALIESAPESDARVESEASGDAERTSAQTERSKCAQPMTRLFSPAAQVRRRRRAIRASPYSYVSEVNDFGDVPTCQGPATAFRNEGESNGRRGTLDNSGSTNLVITMLHQFAKGGSRYDPSHGDDALTRGSHLACDVDVAELRHTQQTISSKFRQGAHGGMPVLELSRRLYLGIVDAHDITPLVAVKLEGKVWVVHGNRRLMALKEFQRLSGQTVHVRCIVYNPASHDDVPQQVVAKLLLHASTRTDGLVVEFSGRRR